MELRIHLAVGAAGHTLVLHSCHSWGAGQEEEELRKVVVGHPEGQEAALLEHRVAKQPETRKQTDRKDSTWSESVTRICSGSQIKQGWIFLSFGLSFSMKGSTTTAHTLLCNVRIDRAELVTSWSLVAKNVERNGACRWCRLKRDIGRHQNACIYRIESFVASWPRVAWASMHLIAMANSQSRVMPYHEISATYLERREF